MKSINQFLLYALRCFLITFFVTGPVAYSQCCTYTLSMHDTYGDGWNGATLKVYINNALIGNISASGFGSVDTFTVCTGDSLRLFYTAGMYENENSYQLYDPSWNLIKADGPTPAIGNVYAATASCFSIANPGNHACNAIPIDTAQCIFVDNSNYGSSGIKPDCAIFQGGDIWFSITVPPSGNLSFETDSGNINDTGIAAWTDNTCTNLRYLGCDDDSGNGYYSFLTVTDQIPGQTVYVQVYGYNGATGSFNFCANDMGSVKLDSSEIPIVMINTLGQTIVPDTKINALMQMKYNGAGNITYVTDTANVYNGNIGIEIRGASSSGYPQRPYGFETRTATGTNNDVSLLGMPAENDWTLLSNFNDRSLVRNTLAYRLFGDMGNYSVRTSLCEVLIDSSYKGIYVFGEKIKRDSGRVDVAKLTVNDTTGDDVTGGYILQQNYWDASNSFQSNYSPIDHPGFDVHFVYEYPKPADIVAKQKTYIAAFIDTLETALYSSNFADTVIGYRKYLDTKSFIDYFLINELARSNDGFKKSVFFNKDKNSNGGKLKAGPIWDFDWAWKNMYGCSIFENTDGSGWAHHINDCPTDNYSCGYYIRLLQDSTFNNELRCTYENYRQTIFDTTYIFGYLDSVRNLVQNAQARHFKKWPILGMSGPAPEVGAIATTYNAEIDTLKNWILLRLNWLDANIPGLCSIASGIAQNNATNVLNYFPNPSNGTIRFEGLLNSSSPMQMEVYNVAGKLIDTKRLQSGVLKFDYQLQQKGVYFFKITNSNGLLQYGKLIVI